MSFEMIREYYEDYKYLGNMRVRSHAKAFADHWDHISSRGLVYNAGSGIHEYFSVARYEYLSYVRSLGQVFRGILGLDTCYQVDVASSTRQLVTEHTLSWIWYYGENRLHFALASSSRSAYVLDIAKGAPLKSMRTLVSH